MRVIPLRAVTHPRIRKYLWHTALAAAMLGIFVYIAAGLWGGERGMAAGERLKREIADLEIELTRLEAKRTDLGRRVDALDPAHVDLDMLGEQARRVLFFSEPNEILIRPETAP